MSDDYRGTFFDPTQTIETRQLACLQILREFDLEAFGPMLSINASTESLLAIQWHMETTGRTFVERYGDDGPRVLMGEWEVFDYLLTVYWSGLMDETVITNTAMVTLAHARPYYRLLPVYERRIMPEDEQ